MNNYIFLKEKNADGPVIYKAIKPEVIKTLRVSKTYDRWGYKIDTCETGDSIELISQKSVDLANKVAEKVTGKYNFSIGDIITGYDHLEVFDQIEEIFLKEGISDSEDFHLYYDECKGFCFWNGHNFITIVVDADGNDGDYEIVEEESLNNELNDALNKKEFVGDVLGGDLYKSGEYSITDSYMTGSWGDYSVYKTF